MNQNIITALKEIARQLIFAIPGIAIVVMSSDPVLASGIGAIILMVLRAIDKTIHDDENIRSNGLLPF